MLHNIVSYLSIGASFEALHWITGIWYFRDILVRRAMCNLSKEACFTKFQQLSITFAFLCTEKIIVPTMDSSQMHYDDCDMTLRMN